MSDKASYEIQHNDSKIPSRRLKRGDVFYGEDHRMRMKLIRQNLSKLQTSLARDHRLTCIEWLLVTFKVDLLLQYLYIEVFFIEVLASLRRWIYI